MEDTRVYLRPSAWLAIIVVLIGGSFYLAGKRIEVRGSPRTTISVDAEGKVTAIPDIALLQFGVQTVRGKTPQEVMETLNKKMTAIVAAVKLQGVEEKDITTRSLSLYPSYDFLEGKRVDRGFEASQSLSVKVRTLTKIPDILNAAVTQGANQVGDVSFTIDDPNTLRAQARQLAITRAKEKAVELAKALQMSLGELRGFNEGGGGIPLMNFARAESFKLDQSGAEPAPTPPVVPTGEQEITVNVTLTYELH